MSPPQWITGTIIHRSNKKVCIQSDGHWSHYIKNAVKVYEWFNKDDNNFQELHDDIVEFSKLAIFDDDSTIDDDSYEIISNEVNIQNSINERHRIASHAYYFHQIFDDHMEQFETVSHITEFSELRPLSMKQLIYIESLKQLFAFVDNNVFYCDIRSPNQTMYKWESLGIQLPFDYQFILAFNHIVMIYPKDHLSFEVSNKNIGDIYCMDLKYKKFFVSNKSCMKCPDKSVGLILKGKDNMAHYVNVDDSSKFHYKWSLSQIIPDELRKVYTKTCDKPLVVGYIREKETIYNMNIPDYLKYIVVTFYPTFLQ